MSTRTTRLCRTRFGKDLRALFSRLVQLVGADLWREKLQTSYEFELLRMRAVHPSFPTPFQIQIGRRARGAMCRVPSRYFKCFGGETAAAAAAAAAVMRCMSCPGAIGPPPFVPRESPHYVTHCSAQSGDRGCATFRQHFTQHDVDEDTFKTGVVGGGGKYDK